MIIDSIDLRGNLPKIDGKLISSKVMLVSTIMKILLEHGYTFDPIHRPVPAFLRNYQSIDRRYLVRFFRNVVNQLRAHMNFPINSCILSYDGFNIKYPNDGRLTRLCIIKYTYNGFVNKYCIPISELSYRVNKLLSFGVKQIEIA